MFLKSYSNCSVCGCSNTKIIIVITVHVNFYEIYFCCKESRIHAASEIAYLVCRVYIVCKEELLMCKYILGHTTSDILALSFDPHVL